MLGWDDLLGPLICIYYYTYDCHDLKNKMITFITIYSQKVIPIGYQISLIKYKVIPVSNIKFGLNLGKYFFKAFLINYTLEYLLFTNQFLREKIYI